MTNEIGELMSWFYSIYPFSIVCIANCNTCGMGEMWRVKNTCRITDKQHSDHLSSCSWIEQIFSTIFIVPSSIHQFHFSGDARGNTINYADCKFTAKRLIKTHLKKKTKKKNKKKDILQWKRQMEWDSAFTISCCVK